ncbi:MAG: DNA-binding transcriptional LysR family regulator [Pseudohongiellaceae bacterium]|jgi:DNA-binding transcriptional LysR family regulator
MLFERTNRRLMLTEAAHQIVICAKRILREVDAIHEIADSTGDR